MPDPIVYPESRRSDHVDTLHGVTVPDPYRWLEELDSDETRDWIERQNEVTYGWLGDIPERTDLRSRIERLWDYEKHGLPVKRGGKYFLMRQSGLENQGVLYVLEDLDAEPRVLLNPNELSEDGTVALTGYALSEDGAHLAYGLSEGGSDWQEWRVRDTATGEDREDHLRWVKFSGASFSHDGLGFYYSRYDAPVDGQALKGANYDQKLYYHRLGMAQEEDTLVYERPDEPEWGFGGQVTDDGRYLIIHVWKGTARENGIFYLDLHDADGEVVELLADFDARYGFVGNRDTVFYFLTDDRAPRSRVIEIDVSDPARKAWREVIPEGEDTLSSVRHVGGRLVATTLHHAHSVVRVYGEDGTHERDLDLPGLGSVIDVSGRASSSEAFYAFTGFTTPGRVFRLACRAALCLLHYPSYQPNSHLDAFTSIRPQPTIFHRVAEPLFPWEPFSVPTGRFGQLEIRKIIFIILK